MIETQESVEKDLQVFSVDRALMARAHAWTILDKIATAMQPGMREWDAVELTRRMIDDAGFEKHWHKPIVRFGSDTARGYDEPFANEIVLEAGDIFFVDIGPVWKGYESDVGKTFVLGDDSEKRRCAQDSELLWKEMRDAWKNQGMTGQALYEFGIEQAKEKGWLFKLEGANGHRLSEFPHQVYYKGNMTTVAWTPAPYLWMLEVQLVHPTRPFGAFFEDLLF